jgi:hypothetical protein
MKADLQNWVLLMKLLVKHSYTHKYLKRETDLSLLDFTDNSQIFLLPSSHTTLWVLYDLCVCDQFWFSDLAKHLFLDFLRLF